MVKHNLQIHIEEGFESPLCVWSVDAAQFQTPICLLFQPFFCFIPFLEPRRTFSSVVHNDSAVFDVMQLISKNVFCLKRRVHILTNLRHHTRCKICSQFCDKTLPYETPPAFHFLTLPFFIIFEQITNPFEFTSFISFHTQLLQTQ